MSMTRINLLPWREERRQERAERFPVPRPDATRGDRLAHGPECSASSRIRG